MIIPGLVAVGKGPCGHEIISGGCRNLQKSPAILYSSFQCPGKCDSLVEVKNNSVIVLVVQHIVSVLKQNKVHLKTSKVEHLIYPIFCVNFQKYYSAITMFQLSLVFMQLPGNFVKEQLGDA